MKVRFNRWYNAVLTALLSMLGYTSCSNDEDNGRDAQIALMYGVVVPYIEWRGTVTDEAEVPIQGITAQVKYAVKDYNNPPIVNYYTVDSVSSNADGRFAIHSHGSKDPDFKLILQDSDGDANGGTFLSDTLTLTDLVAEEIPGNNGVYEIKNKIKLKKK